MEDMQITKYLIDEKFLYLIRNTLFCAVLYPQYEKKYQH